MKRSNSLSIRRRVAATIAPLCMALAAGATPASAEPVVQHLVGTVTAVQPEGSTSFALGELVVLDCRVERATIPTSTPTHATYLDAVLDLEIAIGPHVARLAGGGSTQIDVYNDEYVPMSSHQGYWNDEYRISAGQLLGAPLEAVALRALIVEIQSPLAAGPATFLTDTSIPTILEAELRYGFATFTDPALGEGRVDFQWSSAVTPARPASWGRVKATYAR